MKTITLRFCRSRSLGSAVIRWFTWSRYSHVDIVLENGHLLGAKGDGQGVAIRAPQPPKKGDEALTVDIELDDDTYRRVMSAALKQLGKPYDWRAIAGLVLRSTWQQPTRWFCSELVAYAFSAAGHPLLRTNHHHRITPRDLLLSPYLV